MNSVLIPQMEPWFDENEEKAISDYMKSGGWLTEFKKTEELEKLISNFTGSKFVSITNNGTIAIILALMALDIKRGDEVLVPNLTMIATPNSAAFLGIKPVFVDVEKETLCLDLKLAEKKINKRTKAMIYVPLNGRSGNMQKIIDFCKTNNIFLIEDAAQALGSSWKGRHLGTFGDIGTLSFSVPKIITMGQGGALLTNSEKLYRKIELLKDFGRESGGSDIHNNWGWNFKFTDLQAVIGIEQMKKLEARIKRKKEIYKRYQKAFVNIKELKLLKTNLKDTAPWFIDIYVANPDSLSLYLRELSIGTRRVYPAISSQKIYQDGFKDDDFPVSKEAANQGLWLPSSTKLSNKEVDIITECIAGYYENLRKAKKVVDKMFSLS